MPAIELHESNATLPGELLTPIRVALLLDCSPRTVARLAADGRLERVELGHRTVRYTARSVEALVDPTKSSGAPARGAAVKTGEVTAHAQRTP